MSISPRALRSAALIALALLMLAGMASAAGVQVRFWSDGRLVLADRVVPDGMSPEEAAIRALVAGPTSEEIAGGLSTSIPAGVTLVGCSIAGDSAKIDLSQNVIVGLDEARLAAIFDQFRTTLGDFPSITAIRLSSGGKLLSSYLAPAPDVSSAKPGPPAPIIGATGLSGRKIAVGPSHGRFWNGSGWYWQRGDPCGFGEAVLEDTNSVRLVQFLKQYITQDGATFISPRQLDESHCCNGYEGQPWWKMAAYSWLRANGLPTSVWASSSGVGGEETATGRSSDDIRARPLYADYMGADIYIAHHTNAGGGGTANGTETFRDTAMEHPAHEENSLALANNIQNSVIDTIRSTYDGEGAWANRGVKDSAGGFGEIRVPNRPAVLIELAFHDNCSRDAAYLTDDFFRSVSEWAVYNGICGYFGTTPTWGKYSCEYVSDTIPTTMVAGQSYNVSVTLRNRGVCWLSSRSFRLGAVNGNNPFGTFTRVDLSGTIRPGGTYTFNFTLTAPAQGGTFTSAWQMVREGYAWFGPVVSKTINCGPNTDFTPPSVPQNVRSAGSTPSSITVAWDASTDNYGVVGYRIYRNGVQVGSSAGTSFTDTGLNYSTSYSYQVDAYDVVPNYSAKSTPVSLSTPAPPYYTWVASSSNRDAYIRSGSPDSAGPSSAIQVGWSSTGTIATRRGLVAWDMSTAPSQAAVVNAANSVRVKLYCYTRSVNTAYGINLARVTADWTEGGATWNNMSGNSSTVLATASVGIVGDYTWSWNGFTAGLPEQNRGLMVIHQQETTNSAAKIFTDREQYGGANPRPRLEIDYYDIVAPVNCSISIENGAAYTLDGTVALALGATDFPSGMSQMQFSNDGTNWSAAETYGTVKTGWVLSAGDGPKTVFVRYRDISGNWSAPVSDTIVLDTASPTGTVAIEGGAEYTPSASVSLALSSADAVQMRLMNDGGDWTAWEAFAASRSWTLASGDGVKTVSVEFKDAAGNVSLGTVSDTIEVVAATGTIAQAKALDNAGDKKVALLGKYVTARFADCLYIQEPSDGVSAGYSGIRVAVGGYTGGDWVNVAGVMGLTTDGERVILSPTVKDGASGAAPQPVLLTNKSLGGEALNAYTPGFPGLYGTNNVGLLVAATGTLTKTGSGYWFIDDGSGVRFDPGQAGVPVDASLLSTAKQQSLQTGDYVLAIGICQAGSVSGGSAPVIRLRQDADLVSYE